MTNLRRELLRPATWIALLALAVALGGTAYAAATIDSADIVDGSIQSIDIGTDQVLGADIKANAVTGAEVAASAITGADVADGSIPRADVVEGRTLPLSRFVTMVPADSNKAVLSGSGLKITAVCDGSAAEPQALLVVEDPDGASFPAVGTYSKDTPAAVEPIANVAYGNLVANASINDVAGFDARIVVDGVAYDVEGSAFSVDDQPCRLTVSVARLGPA